VTYDGLVRPFAVEAKHTVHVLIANVCIPKPKRNPRSFSQEDYIRKREQEMSQRWRTFDVRVMLDVDGWVQVYHELEVVGPRRWDVLGKEEHIGKKENCAHWNMHV